MEKWRFQVKLSIKKVFLYLAVLFYFVGGINHFINPEFYLPLIPKFFENKDLINIVAGIAELAGAIGLIFPFSRKWAAYGIILMLTAFIPSHIYFIQVGSCIEGSLCAPEVVAWIRLVLIHPLLMYWAFAIRS